MGVPRIAYSTMRESVGSRQVRTIAGLFENCFGQPPDTGFDQRLNAKPHLLALLAHDGERLVGFKIGYERFDGVFFSWLGCVDPSFRRSGLARQLLRMQHAACTESGYREIQCECFGNGTAMLILNLQEGFEIYGTYLGNDGRLRAQLRKPLG